MTKPQKFTTLPPMTKYHLTLKSSNVKVGKIPVSTTSADSCPTTCAFYNKGCYAKSGPLAIHWRKVGEDRGISQDQFLSLITELPSGQFWRHNQAGDLPHTDGRIDSDFLSKLVEANKDKKGFTYTHHKTDNINLAMIRGANHKGFTINLSGNDMDHAVKLSATGLPVVAVIPSTVKETHFEHKGKKFLTCPATYRDHMTCDKCRLCQKADRKYIVAFPAHGTQKKHIDNQQKKG